MASSIQATFSCKLEYQAIIRYLILKGKLGTEIHSELNSVYGGTSALSHTQIKFWVNELKKVDLPWKMIVGPDAHQVTPMKTCAIKLGIWYILIGV